jgi:hypothetical protein
MVAAFSGSAAIVLPTPGVGVQGGGQVIQGISIDGSTPALPNSFDGILAAGYIAAVRLADVTVWGGINVGVHGLGGIGLHKTNDGTASHVPDFWDVSHCKFSACGGFGVNDIGAADSWYTVCESTGNAGGGWSIANGSELKLIGCRGDSNTGPGFSLTGFAGFTAEVHFIGCLANQNSTYGFSVAGAGAGTYVFNGCQSGGNTTGPWLYAGSNNVKSDAAPNTSTAAPTFW